MKLIVACMGRGWGQSGKSWASHLEKEYLQRRKTRAEIADDNTYIVSSAFVGLGSGRIPGNPPSEKVRERFWSVAKPTVSTAAKHHRSTVSFLSASESRLRSLCDDNGPALSLLAPLEYMSSYPPPRSKPSDDFIAGHGRQVKVLGRNRRLPTLQSLRSAGEDGLAILQLSSLHWALPMWAPAGPIDTTLATGLLEAKLSRSEKGLLAVWSRMGLVEQDGDAWKVKWSAFQHAYESIAMVQGGDCSCKVYWDDSSCPHEIVVADKRAPNLCPYPACTCKTK